MNRIRALRESKGLTQEALGKMVGVSQSTINKYETDAIPLTVPKAALIAEKLGVELYEVLGLKLNRKEA